MTDNSTFRGLTFTKKDEELITEGGEYFDFGGIQVRLFKARFFVSEGILKIPDSSTKSGFIENKEGKILERKGGTVIDDNGPDELIVLILHKRDKEQEPYKAIIPFSGKKAGDQYFSITKKQAKNNYPNIHLSKYQDKELERDGETKILAWQALQYPELELLAQQGASKQLQEGKVVWYKAQLLRTGGASWDHATKENPDGTPKKMYPQYRASFELFKTENEMRAAEKEHWGEREVDDSRKDWHKGIVLPADYDNQDPAELLDFIQEKITSEASDRDIIETCELDGYASDKDQTPTSGEAILAAAKKAIYA